MEKAHVHKINLENATISYVAFFHLFTSRLEKKNGST